MNRKFLFLTVLLLVSSFMMKSSDGGSGVDGQLTVAVAAYDDLPNSDLQHLLKQAHEKNGSLAQQLKIANQTLASSASEKNHLEITQAKLAASRCVSMATALGFLAATVQHIVQRLNNQ